MSSESGSRVNDAAGSIQGVIADRTKVGRTTAAAILKAAVALLQQERKLPKSGAGS